jgi:hypothetical protein
MAYDRESHVENREGKEQAGVLSHESLAGADFSGEKGNSRYRVNITSRGTKHSAHASLCGWSKGAFSASKCGKVSQVFETIILRMRKRLDTAYRQVHHAAVLRLSVIVSGRSWRTDL